MVMNPLDPLRRDAERISRMLRGTRKRVGVTYMLPVTEPEARHLAKVLKNSQRHVELEAKVIELNRKLDYQRDFSKSQA